jgi:DNA-binding MarR family transcriptional regulator
LALRALVAKLVELREPSPLAVAKAFLAVADDGVTTVKKVGMRVGGDSNALRRHLKRLGESDADGRRGLGLVQVRTCSGDGRVKEYSLTAARRRLKDELLTIAEKRVTHTLVTSHTIGA